MKNKILKFLSILIEVNIILIIVLTSLYFAFLYKTHSTFQIDKVVLFKILTEMLLVLSMVKFVIEKKLTIYINKKYLYITFLFFFSYLITVIFSVDIQSSIWGSYWRQQGLITYSHYFLFFILLVINIERKEKIKRIIDWTIIGSIVVCVLGLLQWVGIDFVYNGLYPSTRVTSTLGQPIFFGNYLVIIIPLIFYKIINNRNKYLKVFFTFVLFLNLACLLLTQTRGSWLGFLGGVFIYLLIYYIFFKKNYKKILLFILVFIALLSGLVIFTGKDSAFVDRIRSFSDMKSGSLAMRLEIWKSSSLAIMERPVIGYGPETQKGILIKHYSPNWSIYETLNAGNDRAHNIFLDLMLQGGVFYLIVYLLFLFYIFYISLEMILENKNNDLLLFLFISLASYFIALLVSFEITETNILFWLIIAFIFLIQSKNSKKININFSKLYYIVFLLIIIIIYFYILESVNAVRADYYMRLTRKDLVSNDFPSMYNNYLDAIYYNDREVVYKWFFANDAMFSMSKIESKEALIYFSSLIDYDKKNKNFDEKYTEAMIYKILGKYVDEKYFIKSEELFGELINTSPLFPEIYKAWGGVYYLSGDFKKAITIYNITLSLLPDINNEYLNKEHRDGINLFKKDIYRLLASCHEGLGDNDNVLDNYLKIIKVDPYQIGVYKKIADIYYQLGDIDKAIWYNKRGFMLSPNDYMWPFSISVLYKERGNLEEAVKYANQALVLSLDNKDVIKFINELNGNKK